MKKLIVILASLIALSANAQDWVNVGSTTTQSFDIKAHSLVLDKDNSGKDVVRATGRIVDKKLSEYNEFIWYISLVDCAKGQGTFNMALPDGDFFLDLKFKLGEDTPAAAISGVLCTGANNINHTTPDKKKGIST